MYLQRQFRILDYLTLGLACWCLVVAEAPFFAGIEWSLPAVGLLLYLAWRREGRWHLPVWGANVLALILVTGDIIWVRLQWRTEASWLHNVPMPAGLVPTLGPVLMGLLLVKLFQPRLPGDFWLLQGMGLLQVSLACVLATGPELGMLLAGYLASGVGCLMGHYLANGVLTAGCPWEERRARARLLTPALRWAAAVGGSALLLFLLTPRGDDSGWDPAVRFGVARSSPASRRVLSGFTDEINLRREGAVDYDQSPAFTVRATFADGRPWTDLPVAELHWRGTILDTYDWGRWTTDSNLTSVPQGGRDQVDLPDLGPGQTFLDFTVRPRDAAGVFLADPVVFGPPDRRLPVLLLAPPNRSPLFAERSGTAIPTRFRERTEYRYRQVLPLAPDRSRTPAPKLDPRYVELLVPQFRGRGLEGLENWTVSLLRRLASDPRYGLAGALPPAIPGAGDRGFLLAPQQWEPVARALEEYLSRGGDYAHSFQLHSQDLALDPVWDFLTNVRQGHCERFASALTLMLRSVGIPARVVKGYHGAESQGEGLYLVRQSQAHSWVEALVPVPERGLDEFDWLSLDPSPDAGGSAPPFSLVRWWEQSREQGVKFWRDLIVGYNAEFQADLMDFLKTAGPAEGLKIIAVLAGVSALVWAGKRLWRRRRRRAYILNGEQESFYGRLLGLLARYAGLEPVPGQTPREFGAAAGAALRGRPATVALADLPAAAAELFYRVRFGARPLSEAESASLDARLSELAGALRQGT
jgi:hypothetical protein